MTLKRRIFWVQRNVILRCLRLTKRRPKSSKCDFCCQQCCANQKVSPIVQSAVQEAAEQLQNVGVQFSKMSNAKNLLGSCSYFFVFLS